MQQLTGGVLHSKFWVVDGRHVYVGSANMDWRSLTQASPRSLIARAFPCCTEKAGVQKVSEWNRRSCCPAVE